MKTYAGLYYVGVFFSDEHTPTRLITNIVQRGYKQVSWTQYKYFDRLNRIKSYFVLNGNHYVKADISFYLRNERYYQNKSDGVTSFKDINNKNNNSNC